MLNKKGLQEYLSTTWLIVLLVMVGLAIAIGVSAYYSAELDVREIEAELLGDNILDCVIENGFLSEDLLEEEFDVFEKCDLSEKVFEEGGDFYFALSVFSESGEKLREDVIGGDVSFVLDCEILRGEDGEKAEAKYFPECITQKAGAKYFDGEKFSDVEVSVLSASNNRGGKVPVI